MRAVAALVGAEGENELKNEAALYTQRVRGIMSGTLEYLKKRARNADLPMEERRAALQQIKLIAGKAIDELNRATKVGELTECAQEQLTDVQGALSPSTEARK